MRVVEFAAGIALGLGTITRRFGFLHELAALALLTLSLAVPAPAALKAALCFLPSAAALIVVYSRSDGPISKFLSWWPLVLLGDASFSLYMVHYPLARYFGRGVIQLFGAIFLSVAMLVWFERPVQAWLLNKPVRFGSVVRMR